MAPKIKILDPLLASKIAAGEVVQGPSSVVKELIENSLDSGASIVTVHLMEGGRRLIRVTDDGCGMSREDAKVAFLRHSTSKVSTEDDLQSIKTMGFRGEALASISAVARVVLRTKERGELSGTRVTIEGGGDHLIEDDGCPEGTAIEVKDLFYNTPARLKFLRTTETEFGKALEVFRATALINPDKGFRLYHGSSKTIELRGRGGRGGRGGEAPFLATLKDRVAELFGADAAKRLMPVQSPFLTGFLGPFEETYPTLKALYIYVNGRPIRDKSVNRAIIDGYGTLLDSGRFPFVALDLTIPFEDVDVNIHPAKSEVRFKNPGFIYDAVKAAVRDAISLAGKAVTAAFVTKEALSRGFPQGVMPETREAFAPYVPAPYVPAKDGALGGLGLRTGHGVDARNQGFLNIEPVGQLWGEFLMAESGENGGEFYIIDQHGLEERAAYERIRKEYYGGEVGSQMLLIPERVETGQEETAALESARDGLKRLGFDIAPFGPSTVKGGETFLIKAIPQILSGRSSSDLVKDLSAELSAIGGSSRIEEKIDSVLMRIACHSVIRGARTLTREEAGALLWKLTSTDFALNCPHGRPVVKRISRREVEAFFKR